MCWMVDSLYCYHCNFFLFYFLFFIFIKRKIGNQEYCTENKSIHTLNALCHFLVFKLKITTPLELVKAKYCKKICNIATVQFYM